MMSNKSGMIVVEVVLVALLVLIQTSTITAVRPLPASANTRNKVQVADTNNVVNVAQHVPASVSSKSALLPKDCGVRYPYPRDPTVPEAAATSDVARPVPASANADKVQVAVATNDVPNVARLVPNPPDENSILPQTYDFVVGGPSVHG